MAVAICARCRAIFDPAITPVRFADKLLCSWHPGTPEDDGNLGAYGDYADRWKWSCCGKVEITPIIEVIGERGLEQRDHAPIRSPGCTVGPHIADNSLQLADFLASGLEALQSRLKELSAHEVRGQIKASDVFISYCHADGDFVDILTGRLTQDDVNVWRDEKDILVGEVIDRAICDGIQKNSMFLAVLTPSSMNSRWVQREIDEASHEATEGRKLVLPILANGLSLTNIPPRLRRLKSVQFDNNFDSSYKILL